MKLYLWLILLFTLFSSNSYADNLTFQHLEKAPIHRNDLASLQRGARVYFNYCMGCHSLKYVRYNRLAKDMGIVDPKGRLATTIVKQNFMFGGGKISDTIRIAILPSDAQQWFGVAPPDLSLVARARGVDWLYTFLLSFYKDPTRIWGSNNLLYPDVAMPNILLPLQGTQLPVYRPAAPSPAREEKPYIDHLMLVENGTMSAPEFRALVADVVNFLDYVGDPSRAEREQLGRWVLLFLAVFIGVLYLLKRAYWKKL